MNDHYSVWNHWGYAKLLHLTHLDFSPLFCWSLHHKGVRRHDTTRATAKPATCSLTDYTGLIYSNASMTKEKLIEIIKTLLKTDADLGFLFQLKEKELEKLVACIRRRTDQIGK